MMPRVAENMQKRDPLCPADQEYKVGEINLMILAEFICMCSVTPKHKKPWPGTHMYKDAHSGRWHCL